MNIFEYKTKRHTNKHMDLDIDIATYRNSKKSRKKYFYIALQDQPKKNGITDMKLVFFDLTFHLDTFSKNMNFATKFI